MTLHNFAYSGISSLYYLIRSQTET